MASDSRIIEAAGGVLWRPAATGGVEVCLVHRPKYDDLSLPKGKLDRGEHVLLGAAREVLEETAHTVTIGAPLGEIRYAKDGTPKRVRYWAMRGVAGEFVPNDEVDALHWLSPREAAKVMSPTRDPSVVERFATDAVDTVPIIVLRHASAGDSSTWEGDDRDRPLDEIGMRQAATWAEILPLYAVECVLSADVARCLDTVTPFAEKAGVPVDADPLLSEHAYDDKPSAVTERALAVADAGRPVVLCSQGTAIPDIVRSLCTAYGVAIPDDPSLRKGTAWVLHVVAGTSRALAVERVVA